MINYRTAASRTGCNAGLLALLALSLSGCGAPPGASPPPAVEPALAGPPAAAVPAVRNKPTTFETVGVASWYGAWHHGKTTASGAPFNKNALTAAHKSLKLGTKVEVTNLANQRSVVLTINDRGPYVRGRMIDVSEGAAKTLGFREAGLARVRIRVLPA